MKWVVLGLLAAATAWPAEPDSAAVLRRMNRDVVAHPSRAALRERAQLLRQIIVNRPKLAAGLLLPPADADAVRMFAEPDTLETPESAIASTVLIADSEDWTTSAHVYIADTPRGRITAYQDSARAPHAGCGASIRIEGFRLGDVMLVTQAAVVRAATPQPNCAPTGEHRVAVLMLSMPGLPGLPVTPADVRKQFFDLSSANVAAFYAENSYGLASIAGDVYGPIALSRAYQCNEPATLLADAIKAADSTVDFTRYTHVHLLHPDLPGGCGWTGMGSVGCETVQSPSKGTLRMAHVLQNVRNSSITQTASHEIGHNFGAMHARSIEFPGEMLAPDRTHAIYSEYGDRFSVMGSGSLSHFAAPHKALFGWLQDGHEIRTIAANADATIAPLSSQADAVKALRVRRNLGRAMEWVWVEYRQAIGFDAGMRSTGWTGATLHYESAATDGYTEAVDYSPRPVGSTLDSFADVAIAPGQKWADPYSDLTIEVVSAALDGVEVRVRYEVPCARVTWPAAGIDNAGGLLVTGVSADDGCSTPVSANNFWILPADAPGAFQVSANPTYLARSGSVTVARQTLFLNQPAQPAAPQILAVAPSSGAVNIGGQNLFTLLVSSPNGLDMLGSIDLAIGTCRVHFDYAGRTMEATGAGCSAAQPSFTAVAATAAHIQAIVTFTEAMAGSQPVLAGTAPTGEAVVMQPAGSLNVTTSCEPDLSSRRLNVNGWGASYNINVNGNCSWTAMSMDSWVGVSPTQGSASGQLRISVPPNLNAAPRSTEVHVLDAVISIAQAGTGMPYFPSVTFDSPEIRLARMAGAGIQYFSTNLQETALASASDADWLHVDSVRIDSFWGPTLNYSYDANLTGQPRVGTITIFGAPLIFFQDGGAAAGADYIIHAIAGSGEIGDGGPATDAALEIPSPIAYGPDGSLYIGEANGYRIRKVSPDGIISTFIDTLPWAAAGLAVDARGRVLFSRNDTIRAAQPDGTVVTLVSGLNKPAGLAVDTADNIYIAETGANRVAILSPDGRVTTVPGTTTAGLRSPTGVALDSQGNLYIADSGNRLVRRVSGGTINTIAGAQSALSGLTAIAVDAQGAVWFTANNRVYTLDARGTLFTAAGGGSTQAAAGVAATSASFFGVPNGLAFSPGGQLAIADTIANVVWAIRGGALAAVAGRQLPTSAEDGGPATAARIFMPWGAAAAPDGSLYIPDSSDNVVRRVSPDGIISTVAGTGWPGSSGDGGPATAAKVRPGSGIAVDSAGNIFVTDLAGARVRKITNDGKISTVAGTETGFTDFRGIAVDLTGNLYIAEPSSNRVRVVSLLGTVSIFAGTGRAGFAGDGGPARSATLSSPTSVGTDTFGNVYIVDSGNFRIRKVGPDGIITTIAGDGLSNIDSTLALNRSMNLVDGLAVDADGAVWFADFGRSLIGRILPDGTVTTVAGGTGAGFSGDDGPGWNARLDMPHAVAVSPDGRVYVVDTWNNRVRVLEPRSN
jgi:M6 family metalloprotease-like protein